MKFGLFAVNMYACSYPETAIQIAQLAEEAGFESLWAGEHVVLPDPQAPPSPMAPHDRILDPLIALTYLSAHTSQVRLGTGIIILPQRNPLVLAKELASLDELSGGRLICGIGVGYLEPEFRALGIPFTDRGARTDDYLAAMRAIWTQPTPAIMVALSRLKACRLIRSALSLLSLVGNHPLPIAAPSRVRQGGMVLTWISPGPHAHWLKLMRSCSTLHARKNLAIWRSASPRQNL